MGRPLHDERVHARQAVFDLRADETPAFWVGLAPLEGEALAAERANANITPI